MQAYIIRRVLALLPTLFFASLIVFLSMRLIPGDVIDLMLAQNDIATSHLELPFTRYFMEASAARETERRFRERSAADAPVYAVVYVHDGLAVMESLQLE